MKKIIIEGKFNGTINCECSYKIFETSPDNSISEGTYNGNFEEQISTLKPGVTYNVRFNGWAADGSFNFKVTGDIEEPINKTRNETFSVLLTLTTKA